MCEMCDDPHMSTDLDIDPHLVDRVVAVTGERTRTAVVTRPLREYVARHEQKRLVELFASLDWDPGYDYRADRSRSWISSPIRASGRWPSDVTGCMVIAPRRMVDG